MPRVSAPILGSLAKRLSRRIRGNQTEATPFPGSAGYWEARYTSGGTSGAGSYGRLAEFKAEILNSFVAQHGVQTVIELGCGDGNQLELARYPRYLGLDVSETAISWCKKRFSSDTTKRFKLMREYDGEIADLALSLDVIYHLVEDEVFEDYMRVLFAAASRYVAIYSCDFEQTAGTAAHIRCRKFTRWVKENVADWVLMSHIPNRYPYKGDEEMGSISDFFFYEKAQP